VRDFVCKNYSRERLAPLAGNHRTAFLAFIISILFLPAAFAQIIPSGRIIDWSTAGCVVPSASWPIYTNAMSAGAKGDGVTDDTAVLTAIFASCPPGQIVYLPAGNYVVSSTFVIQHSVVIRGAGPSQTIITPTTNVLNPVFTFQPAASRWTGVQQFAQLSGGYNKGSTTLTLAAPVANPASVGFVVGNELTIDQLNDGTFVNPNGSEGYCGFCSISNGTRAMTQIVHLTGIDSTGTNITIDTPLYWTYGTNNLSALPPFGNYTSSLSPEISWFPSPNLANCGLEDLNINDYYATNASGVYNSIVGFFYCSYCWMRNVETQYGGLAHVTFFDCYHCTLRDSYLLNSKSYASQSYGVEMCNGTTACLAENNIMNNLAAALTLDWGAAGNVFAYNYIPNCIFYQTGWNAESLAVHACHAMFNLLEGNETPSIALDVIHGSCSHMTIFRNISHGWQPGMYANCIAVQVMAGCTYANIVGNVLGTPSSALSSQAIKPNSFFMLATNAGDTMDMAIYAFGYDGLVYLTSGYDFNPLNTAIVSGNYDFYTQSTIWASNNTTTIPNSLYLSSQPSWWTTWGATRWPPIGPDVPGMTNMLPARLRLAEMGGAAAPTALLAVAALVAPSNLHVVSTGATNQPASSGTSTVLAAGTSNQSLGSCVNIGDSWQLGPNGPQFLDVGDYTAFKFIASRFTASSSYTACGAALEAEAQGNPMGNLAVFIYPDNNGVPGSAPVSGGASQSVSMSVLTAATNWINFTGLSAPLTAGKAYWLAVEDDTYDPNNYLNWLGSNPDGLGVIDYSPDGVNWSSLNQAHYCFEIFHQ